MTLFLTSDPIGRTRMTPRGVPCPFRAENRFLDNLRTVLPDSVRTLFIFSDPEDFTMADMAASMYQEALRLSGIDVCQMDVWDHRTKEHDLLQYDFVILAGGHVPTENAFFREINLKEKLSGYSGVVMGISAGTMNCAGTVYAQPELEGEATDPAYVRFLPGLGLTEINILPHWQMLEQEQVDGLRIKEDITLPDSMGRTFYCLVDGSYVLVRDGVSTLHGQGWRVRDGILEEICRPGEAVTI